jgi:hypothetical protein
VEFRSDLLFVISTRLSAIGRLSVNADIVPNAAPLSNEFVQRRPKQIEPRICDATQIGEL